MSKESDALRKEKLKELQLKLANLPESAPGKMNKEQMMARVELRADINELKEEKKEEKLSEKRSAQLVVAMEAIRRGTEELLRIRAEAEDE